MHAKYRCDRRLLFEHVDSESGLESKATAASAGRNEMNLLLFRTCLELRFKHLREYGCDDWHDVHF